MAGNGRLNTIPVTENSGYGNDRDYEDRYGGNADFTF